MADIFVVKDFQGHVRARVSADGSVVDAQGNVVGFVNDDGSCGDNNEELLGEINHGGQVLDALGETVGHVDFGTGMLKEPNNSTLCEIDTSGGVKDTLSSLCGTIEGFSFKQLRMAAAYIFFFDQGFVKANLPSRVSQTPAQPVEDSIVSKEEKYLEQLIPKSSGAEVVAENEGPVTDERGLSIKKLLAKSEQEKIKGNTFYTEGSYTEAVECYTKAIELAQSDLPDCAVYYANRAAAYLALTNYQQVIEDCNKALELNPLYIKALLRRAQAHETLQNLNDALNDYKKVQELDSSITTAQTAVERVNNSIKEKKEKETEQMLGQLKEVGNTLLKKWGLSLDNFKTEKNANGSYKINFVK